MKSTMLIQTASSDKRSDLPIEINNCGCYIGINTDTVINRPRGRKDYQLLLITSGSGYFTFDGTEISVGSGNMILYLPAIPQIYRFEKSAGASYYWLHFSGTQIEEIVKKHNLFSGIRQIDNMPEAIDFFNRLIRAKMQPAAREEYACGILLCLLSYMLCTADATITRLEKAADLLLKSRIHELSLRQIAESCGMSVSHFSREFKKQYGVSPHAYHLSLKITAAKNLLTDTDLSVTDISDTLGFDDPLYFSRIFKKHCGVSPTEYRVEKSVPGP